MSGNVGRLPWFLIDLIMVMALGIAIIYGTRQWGRRGRPRGPMSKSEARRVLAENRAAVKRASEESGDGS
jgi:hypothetical protein